MKRFVSASQISAARASGPLEDPCSVAPALHRVRSVADAVASCLVQLGVRHAFGINGRALAPFMDALLESPMEVVHTRHESGAAFAALEASLVTERPTLVFTTSGPGITNALTGLMAARWEGGRVILVSPATSAAQRGRGAFQETSPHTLPPTLFTAGTVFHDAVVLESPEALESVSRRFATGLTRTSGFVAHLCLPVSVQLTPWPLAPWVAPVEISEPRCGRAELKQVADSLKGGRSVIWAGFGARHSQGALVRVAERLQAPVMATPRAKGTFPERHPLYLGVTGLGGDGHLAATVEALAPDYVLVLGTRLGEYSSLWAPALRPKRGMIVVDAQLGDYGAAFGDVPLWGVQSEVRAFLTSLERRLPARIEWDNEPTPRVAQPLLTRTEPRRASVRGVHPADLMEAIQFRFVERSDAVIFTEAGNAFAWGSQALRFDQPRRYRTSMGWGSMGAAATGVIGAALARQGKAVALLGDGAMLMQSEVSTAVAHRLPVVWIVLNDGQYGMVHHGMSAHGLHTGESRFPEANFWLYARSVGCDGVRVVEERQLDGALKQALEAEGPFVVDVVVDPTVPPPLITRVVAKGPRDQGEDDSEVES